MDKGEIEIYQEKTIVKDVKDPILEINQKEALKVEPDLEVGDPFVEIIDPDGNPIEREAFLFLENQDKEENMSENVDEESTTIDTEEEEQSE